MKMIDFSMIVKINDDVKKVNINCLFEVRRFQSF